MGRLPDEWIERLKNDIDIKSLLESAGITLKRNGANFIGLCPFHDDREPSLVVTPSRQLWHCMGACKTGGSTIDWVMHHEQLSFREACDWLRERYMPHLSQKLEHRPSKKRNGAEEQHIMPTTDDHELSAKVIQYYHQTLKSNTAALAYLEKRGLKNDELIGHFQLGFANRSLSRWVAQRESGIPTCRDKLKDIGFIKASGHEHFAGSLVVPIFDANGNLGQAYGRKINDGKLRNGTPKHLYLPGAHRAVWNLAGLKGADEVILCESLIDALTFWVNGFRNVTCSYGTPNFKPCMLDALKAHGIKRILIAYDRDDSGNNAAIDLAAKLSRHGLDCFRIEFPKDMDANEYACGVEAPSRAFDQLIRNAKSLCANADPKIESNQLESKPPTITKPAQSGQRDLDIEINGTDILITLGGRSYRINIVEQNLAKGSLKINCFVTWGPEYHADVFNLYSAFHRGNFAKQVSALFGLKEGVIGKDLGKILLKLEELAHAPDTDGQTEKIELSEGEKQQAISFLKTPGLLNRILDDFEICGLIGERTNKLTGYLVAISRKLRKPLGAMILSSSASGKTTTMDAILDFVPDEDLVKYSAITGQALYYKAENDLVHKIIAIVEEEGAEKASYPLKLLLSEGELIIASAGKHKTSGEHATQDYRVKGPVAVFVTSTSVETDTEFENRCLVLTVDESRAQTKAIHRIQRQRHTIEGLKRNRKRDKLIKLHQNAQRMLRSLPVVNPYAMDLTFLDDKTRMRRDQEKYLNLIDACAFLHQYQRPIKTLEDEGDIVEYIEATLDDIAIANQLAHEVLGRSLDELPPQTRNLLSLIHQMVLEASEKQAMDRRDYRFTRRDVREYTSWGNTQVKIHLMRLEDMEYLLMHRGCRGQQIVYELLYDGEGYDHHPFLMGLLNVTELKQKYESDGKQSGLNGKKSVPSRAQVVLKSAPNRGTQFNPTGLNHVAYTDSGQIQPKMHAQGGTP